LTDGKVPEHEQAQDRAVKMSGRANRHIIEIRLHHISYSLPDSAVLLFRSGADERDSVSQLSRASPEIENNLPRRLNRAPRRYTQSDG
jgi:hypothetical protein